MVFFMTLSNSFQGWQNLKVYKPDDFNWFKGPLPLSMPSGVMGPPLGSTSDFLLVGLECFLFPVTLQEISPSFSFLFIYLFIYYILLGRIFRAAQRERAQEDSKVPFKGAPPHPPPPIRIRKTATAPGSPYSFQIVRGFFNVPQNYQHSRNCETGPPAYRPYPRRLESLTICR